MIATMYISGRYSNIACTAMAISLILLEVTTLKSWKELILRMVGIKASTQRSTILCTSSLYAWSHKTLISMPIDKICYRTYCCCTSFRSEAKNGHQDQSINEIEQCKVVAIKLEDSIKRIKKWHHLVNMYSQPGAHARIHC